MKHLHVAAAVIGLAAYAAAFYATPLSSVADDAGRPLLRAELLRQLALRPDEFLFPKWFGAPPDFCWVDRLPILLTAAAILAWAALVGWLLMVLCRAQRGLGRGECAVFSIAVGLNALSTWTLALGLAGVMGRLWMVVLPASLSVAAAGYVWRCRRRQPTDVEMAQVTTRVALPPGDCHGVLPVGWQWLGVPFVLAIFLAAMLPPLDFDVREYHLQAPKEFFQQGQITFLAHNVYANMALGSEMLSLLAMVITGDWWLGALVGKTVIAAFTPLTACALLLAGRRLFSPAAGVAAALIYLSIPWVVGVASAGFVEGASACYLFLAVYALMLRGKQETQTETHDPIVRFTQPTDASLLLLAGYLAGAAVATKYPAALFVLLPLGAWVLLNKGAGAGGQRAGIGRFAPPAPNPDPRTPPNAEPRTLRPLLATTVFLLAAAIGCGLWFGKNWALTGNPTYPLLYEVFDGKTWNAQKQQQWNRVHRPHDFSPTALGNDLGRVALTSEWLSPLLAPLAALAFVGRGRRSKLRWWLLAYVGFVIGVWWLATHRIDRFWIPVLPVVALLAGAGSCWTSERWWRWLLPMMLVMGLGANFLVATADQGNAWFVCLSQLRDAPDWIDPWHRYFNAHTTQGRLLAVGDAAVFDLKPRVMYNTCFDDCILEQLVKGRTAAEVRAELAARQIAYVYVNWDEIARYRRTYGYTEFVQPEVFDRLVAQGVLDPLPPIEGSAGQGFRVSPP